MCSGPGEGKSSTINDLAFCHCCQKVREVKMEFNVLLVCKYLSFCIFFGLLESTKSAKTQQLYGKLDSELAKSVTSLDNLQFICKYVGFVNRNVFALLKSSF